MPILTPQQASETLRCEADDPRMLGLLPQVDAYIQNATGRDWSQDNPINAEAIAAAAMLLVKWFENPAMSEMESDEQPQGLSALLLHLEIAARDA